MAGFTKLFNSILQSTIWTEPNETRILWITMLAMSDKFGCVNASIPGLARTAGISIEETELALKRFQEPDAYSRTKDHEGRRVEEIEGGWRLLNHSKYRALMSVEERREYNRVKQAERRASLSKNVKPRQQKSMTISNVSTLPDADADTEAVEKNSVLLKNPEFAKEWMEFVKSRKAMKKPMTDRAQELVLKRLEEHPDKALAGLRMAIERGWQGFKWEWTEDRRNGNKPAPSAESAPPGYFRDKTSGRLTKDLGSPHWENEAQA